MSVEPDVVKVLMVTPRYSPSVGGTETHVYEVGRRVAERGVALTLLTTAPAGSAPSVEMADGMRIIRVRAWPPRGDYFFAPGIETVMKSENWDLVHCQSCHTFVPILAMRTAQKLGLPYVLTFHTGGHSSQVRTLFRGLQWRLLKPLFAGAQSLIGVSQFEAAYFCLKLGLPVEKFEVIPNGASDLAAYLPSGETITPENALIVSVGRLEKYKGHHRLILALPEIHKYCPAARLLILGQGPYELVLRELAKSAGVANFVEIRSISPARRAELAMTLARASLVALLSQYEAHPVSIMEALSLRKPVLVANTSGLSELARWPLVKVIPLRSSAQKIAQTVAEILAWPPRAEDVPLPTWDDCAERLLTLYQRVVSERRAQCVS